MKDCQLKTIADVVRRDILQMGYMAQSAHVGGALSAVEIMVCLYFDILRVYPHIPDHFTRDRVVFSKGHDVKVLYAVLARKGFFSPSILATYEQDDSKLSGHNVRGSVPGVEVTAGSLGHGLSIACGMAYVLKKRVIRKGNLQNRQKSTHRPPHVYAILSDGECDSGSTWEAALFAGHHQLDNLVAVIDYNKLQGFGFTKDVLDLEPFEEKWKSFGWHVVSCDGHDFSSLRRVFRTVHTKPLAVIAHTIKGRGGIPKHVNAVSSQYMPPTEDEMREWLKGKKKSK